MHVCGPSSRRSIRHRWRRQRRWRRRWRRRRWRRWRRRQRRSGSVPNLRSRQPVIDRVRVSRMRKADDQRAFPHRTINRLTAWTEMDIFLSKCREPLRSPALWNTASGAARPSPRSIARLRVLFGRSPALVQRNTVLRRLRKLRASGSETG